MIDTIEIILSSGASKRVSYEEKESQECYCNAKNKQKKAVTVGLLFILLENETQYVTFREKGKKRKTK